MQKTGKKLTILLAVLFAFVVFGMQADNAYAAESGACGDSVTWSLDDDGVLTISGSGAMADYSNPTDAPYAGNDIMQLIVEEGVTAIGANAFGGLFLDYVMLPESLISIGENAFDAASVTEVHFAGNLKQWRETIVVESGNDTLTSVIIMDKDVTYDYTSSSGHRGFSLANGVLTIRDLSTIDISYAYSQSQYPEFYAFKNEYNDYVFQINLEMAAIPDYICSGLTNVQTATIADGPTQLGAVFSGCTSLISVTIPNSVTRIYQTFRNCTSLTSVSLPESLTEVGSASFYECGALNNITLPDSITIIGSSAFYGCSALKSIVIPEGVTSVGDHAFTACSELTTVLLPNTITSIARDTFSNCKKLVNIVIPSSVTSIEESAFVWCGFNTIFIPDSVVSIGKSAFSYNMNLTSVTIPNSVTSISDSMFYNCRNLKSVHLPDTITSIGDDAFNYCLKLTDIVLPDSVVSIGANAFDSCWNLDSIEIPDGVTIIKDRTFYDCTSLTSITIPYSVTSIGDDAFGSCQQLQSVYYDGTPAQWSSITIGNGNTALNNVTMYYAIASGTIGDIVWTLRSNGLLKVGGTGIITDYASSTDTPWHPYANQITALSVGNGVTHIGNNAFNGLSTLESIKSLGRVQTIGDNAFTGCSALAEIPRQDALTTIGANCFADCASLSKLSIGYRVTSVGQNAFNNCPLLTTAGEPGSGASIEFGWKTAIPSNAFYGANYLASVTIPSGVTRIMKGAFQNCTALTSVNLPSTLRTIQEDALRGCNSLTRVEIPAGVNNIGANALVDCSALTEVVVDPANTAYCSESGILFNKDKTELILYPAAKPDTTYVIPATVVSVADNAFKGNPYLAELTVHEALTSIGESSFDGCTGITDVWYDSTDVKWNSISIGDNNDPLVQATIHATHEYGDPVWTWSTDHDSAEATFTCLNGDSIEVVTATVSDNVTEATCEVSAYTVYTAVAVFEGQEYTNSVSVEIAPPLGHNWSEWTVTTEPTCSAVGKKVRTCYICGATETEEIEMLAHTHGAAVIENREEPTCTEAGEYDEVVYCTVCGEEISRRHIELDALSHDWNEWEVTTEATCEKPGVETRICSRCEETETREIEVLAHTPGEVVEENRVEPTCTEEGGYDKVIYCTACGHEISREYTILSPLGHDYEAVVTAPTCTMQGYTTYTCAVCGDSYIDDYVEPFGHNYVYSYEWAEDNSSVTATAVCSHDESHVVTETVVPTSVTITAPTETDPGEVIYTAAFSKDLFTTQSKAVILDPLGHIVKRGDVNDDGVVNTYDRVVFSRYLARWKGYSDRIVDINAMDIDQDGRVNAKDRVILTRYVAEWDGYNAYFE